MTPRTEFSILGPVRVTVDAQPLTLGGPKQRAVLAMLLLDSNRVVSTDRLIDGVWGDEPHDGATSTLQVYISNLRKLLGPDRIVTERPGYMITVGPGELDLARFDELSRAANADANEGRFQLAVTAFEDALACWQGDALADLQYEPFALTVIGGLNERRESVRESIWEAKLNLGRHHELIAELERAVGDTPLRERRWAQLMTALYRSGRQADALAAFGTARNTLVDQLGIDPGAELRRLEESILNQDPSLDLSNDESEEVGALTTVRRAPDGNAAALTLPNGSRIELTSRIWSLGRSPECDIVLNSPDVSRRHAELRPDDEHVWMIADLGSTNGVSVNHQPVDESPLADGDEISLGRFTLVYQAPNTQN